MPGARSSMASPGWRVVTVVETGWGAARTLRSTTAPTPAVQRMVARTRRSFVAMGNPPAAVTLSSARRVA